GDFPFLFVQLAPFMKIEPEPKESNWAELRDAQLYTTKAVPNTAMAVITDVGDEKDIHPRDKDPVGQRLAIAALAIAYKEPVEHTGPVFESMTTIQGGGDAGLSANPARAVLTFTHVGKGLVAKGSEKGEVNGFAVQFGEGSWRPVRAR